MKKHSLFVLFLVLILVVAGCSTSSTTNEETDSDKEASNEPKVLNLNNSSEPGSLHPATAQGTHDSWVLDHVFEGLVKKDASGQIVPGIAERWQMSQDGITWTFELKEGIKWSDGEPVTAHDFEYAWKYALKPETAADYAYQLYYLANGEQYNKGTATEEQVGVKALDDLTLEVKLAAATPFFLDLTTHYTYYPISKKVQEANPKWAEEAESYVSNGPFTLTEWNHKESMKLEKNEQYYDTEKVHLDEVNFVMIENENTAWQMYQTGELDLAYPLPTDVTGQLIASEDPQFQNGPDLAMYYYNFNTNKKPFNNVKVRKALAMSIDRTIIAEKVAQGGQKPAYSVVPNGIPEGNGDFAENTGQLFEENIDEAKKLLAEGLAEEGMKTMPNFTILYNTLDAHKKIAEAIQEMWRKNLDVNVTLENVEFQVKLDREKAGDYDVSRAGWSGDYVDPMTFLELWVTDGAYNDANWSNPRYDELVQVGRTSLDEGKRMESLHQAEEILIEEMPIIPIYFYTRPYMVKEYVTGVYSPINRYPQFQYADMDMSKK